MRLHTRGTKLVLLLAVLALLATACRGAEETTDAGEGEGDTASASAPATEAEEPADAATDAGTEADGETAPAGDVTFDVGVTEEACPGAVNPDNGCIYLGTISDLTVGPFAALAGPITEAQVAFWNRVNEDGGVGGFDVDVTSFVRDNQYNPEVHSQQYEEIKGEILAIAQSLGSPTTFAILEDLKAEQILTAPASWTSAWLFEDVIVESGNVYCIETMNGLDYLAENGDPIETVMAVHYPGDYGDDGAAGASRWADATGAEFTSVPTVPGADNQGEAIGQIVGGGADVVVITTGPTDAGTLVGQAVAQGFTGRFLFNSPAFNPGLLQSPAADAITAQVTVGNPWESWEADTPAHEAMREAMPDVDGNGGYVSGWAWSYPLLAALETATENGDLTRAGLVSAVESLTSVDYEGMLPEGAGNLAGDPNAAAVRATAIGTPDASVAGGLADQGFYEGETAAAFEFADAPCYEEGV